MEKEAISIVKLDFALKNGTKMRKKELVEGIYKLNSMSEAIWFQVNTQKVIFFTFSLT